MTANGRVEIGFADRDYQFNLAKIGQVLELEDKCGCGVSEIFGRLREGRWKFNDVRETIRLGLIGGGMSAPDALVLTKRYVDERPWAESVPVALHVLLAAIVGVPGDEPGKSDADRAATEADGTTTTDASFDPQSTGLEARSDGPLDRSTSALSGSSPQPVMASIEPTAPMSSPTQ